MRKKGRRQTKSPSLLNYLAGIGGGEGDEYENEELNSATSPLKRSQSAQEILTLLPEFEPYNHNFRVVNLTNP